MPTYEPDLWNLLPETVAENNCYNYATNNWKDWHPPLLWGAEPGRLNGKSICWPVRVANGPGGKPVELCDFHCRAPVGPPAPGATGPEFLIQAMLADGFEYPSDPSNPSCDPECWLVAAYVRRLDPRRKLYGDYHFVRQDTLPNGSKKWSHKPGNQKVTDQKYNETSGKFDGGPITNPATDDIGIGPYIFCGYMCCCPSVEIASYIPEVDEEQSFAQLGGTSGLSTFLMLDLPGREVLAQVDVVEQENGAEWVDGMAAQAPSVYFGGMANGCALGVVVSDRTVTVWNPEPCHLIDESRTMAAWADQFVGWQSEKDAVYVDHPKKK